MSSEQISCRSILKASAALAAVAATSGFAGVFGLSKAFAADIFNKSSSSL